VTTPATKVAAPSIARKTPPTVVRGDERTPNVNPAKPAIVPNQSAPQVYQTCPVEVVDGVVAGVGVPVAVGQIQRCIEGVLLGPGAGGRVVPTLPELHQPGGAILDTALEQVWVLGESPWVWFLVFFEGGGCRLG
jgi:hypothetical protein